MRSITIPTLLLLALPLSTTGAAAECADAAGFEACLKETWSASGGPDCEEDTSHATGSTTATLTGPDATVSANGSQSCTRFGQTEPNRFESFSLYAAASGQYVFAGYHSFGYSGQQFCMMNAGTSVQNAYASADCLADRTPVPWGQMLP